MKEKELYIDYKPHQAVFYVEKDDSSYGPIISGCQLTHDHLDDFFQKKNHFEKTLRDQLFNNEISPVYYYMFLQELGVGELALRVGLSKRKVKKHFNPAEFKKCSLSVIKRYADVFNVSLSAMIQLIIVKEEDKKKLEIEQLKTKNECFELIKIGIRAKNETE